MTSNVNIIGAGQSSKRTNSFTASSDIKLEVAGLSTTCSQKIHNMLAGVDASSVDSKYILSPFYNTRIVSLHQTRFECFTFACLLLRFAFPPCSSILERLSLQIHSFSG